jgi:two-component system invasion response regulator UvrY
LIKILLVDDLQLVREGIKRLLQDDRGLEIVGEAKDGEEAVALAKKLKPDVVIMDVHMPGIGGLVATKRLLHNNRDLRILALTICDTEPYPTRLLQAGVKGYITKGCKSEEMIRAIRAISKGQRYITTEVAQQIAINSFTKGGESPLELLSERELQIMLMIIQGQKVLDISQKLCLSPKTVNSYRYRIFEKLGVKSDVELTLMAMRLGMIEGSKVEVEEV